MQPAGPDPDTDPDPDSYRVLLLEELCASPPAALSRVRVLGELGVFPVHRLFGVLALEGAAVLVDFALVGGALQEHSLLHVLGELRPRGELPPLPDELRGGGGAGAGAGAGAVESCALYLKARFVRSAVGLDIQLYKRAELLRRSFLKDRMEANISGEERQADASS
jgi:hypothetical protein